MRKWKLKGDPRGGNKLLLILMLPIGQGKEGEIHQRVHYMEVLGDLEKSSFYFLKLVSGK